MQRSSSNPRSGRRPSPVPSFPNIAAATSPAWLTPAATFLTPHADAYFSARSGLGTPCLLFDVNRGCAIEALSPIGINMPLHVPQNAHIKVPMVNSLLNDAWVQYSIAPFRGGDYELCNKFFKLAQTHLNNIANTESLPNTDLMVAQILDRTEGELAKAAIKAAVPVANELIAAAGAANDKRANLTLLIKTLRDACVKEFSPSPTANKEAFEQFSIIHTDGSRFANPTAIVTRLITLYNRCKATTDINIRDAVHKCVRVLNDLMGSIRHYDLGVLGPLGTVAYHSSHKEGNATLADHDLTKLETAAKQVYELHLGYLSARKAEYFFPSAGADTRVGSSLPVSYLPTTQHAVSTIAQPAMSCFGPPPSLAATHYSYAITAAGTAMNPALCKHCGSKHASEQCFANNPIAGWCGPAPGPNPNGPAYPGRRDLYLRRCQECGFPPPPEYVKGQPHPSRPAAPRPLNQAPPPNNHPRQRNPPYQGEMGGRGAATGGYLQSEQRGRGQSNADPRAYRGGGSYERDNYRGGGVI